MAEVEKYRTDLEFNADNVPALTRATLNLADNFNAIYNQLFSNDFKLMDAVTKMAANFGATVLTVLLGSELAAEVTAVTKDSLFFTLLKKALEAAGVAWNFNNSSAWYICFGDLLGGLIIQGGNVTAAANVTDATINVSYAISFSSVVKNRFSVPRTSAPDRIFTSISGSGNLDNATVTFKATGTHIAIPIEWIVIGY